jgi:hypothetical protein
MADLGPAENEVVTLGATFIDNPWAIPESSSDTTYDTEYFDHPGVAITAPAGDGGYGAINYPAASQYVTAVGGTTLTADSSTSRKWDETAWAGSSAGCSQYDPKPSWQTDTDCANRTLDDIAAVADPNTPVAYYDTPTQGGWGTASGTAVASAIIAAAYALAGTPGSSDYPAEYPYEHPGGDYTTPGNAYPSADGLNNITSGSDGTCSVTYLCTVGDGYNGPAGLGSPNGTLSLTASGGQSGFIYAGEQSMCLNDADDATTAGNQIQVYTCKGAASENWTAEPDGTVRFDSDYCMTVTGNGTTTGTTVELDTCAASDGGQTWIPETSGALYNPTSGLCLYDPGTTVNGTQLELHACASSRTEQWPLPYTQPAATGPITSQLKTTLCIDDRNAATTADNPVQIYGCSTGDTAQQWTAEPGGTLQILGGCLTTAGNPPAASAGAEYGTCAAASSQHWILHSDGSLQSGSSGLYLTDPGASTTNSTQLEVDTYTGDPDQRWTIP